MNTINPTFELRVVDLKTDNYDTVVIKLLTDENNSRDFVLFDVTWATNEEVVVVIENRIQNEAVVRRCQTDTGNCINVSVTCDFKKFC